MSEDADERLNNGMKLVDEAWYDAMDTLIGFMASDDPRTAVAASSAVLDYVARFGTGLGDPYVPDKRPARSGGEDDDEDGGDYLGVEEK
jgi:hypothetical protein